jgi:integrase/recombinase XerD
MPGKAKVLSSKEIQTILKVLKTDRDRALFATGLYTGLRISEIIAIGQNDVFTTSGGVRNVLKITRLKKKNTVYSNIPIHPKLREMLMDYRKSMHKAKIESPWLFPSTHDPMEHVGRIRAHNILTEAFESVGIDDGSTHSMRRTCLTNMSRAGIPLRTIQEISGHANLGQLQEYLAVDPADSHKAIMSLKY